VAWPRPQKTDRPPPEKRGRFACPGKRKGGRATKTWKDSVKKEIALRRLKEEDVEDRNSW